MHQISQEMQQCIQNCLACHKTCLQRAMNHCLETGGKHTEPAHFRLMINCAEICQTSANFMLSGSDLHRLTCGVCAEVCQRCADDCERVGDMEECVQACQRCAASCRQMAGAAS
ncbi:MAG: four-helix bundle copper-binding protein [Abitibacteriaceae bacterium]|nr:four-helix bundle copper-binding protein [Abditibacteriaceae bacterium]